MAARKQKAKGFSKFLDLIGLVDTQENNGRDDSYDSDFDSGRTRSRSTVKRDRSENEFYDEPRVTRTQPRRDRSAQNVSFDNDTFDADEGWNDSDSYERPEYGARTQQRAQGGTRPSSGKYGGAQSARNSTRHDASPQQGSSANQRRANAYQRDGGYQSGNSYQAGGYRVNYSGYNSASRQNDSDNSSYYGNRQPQEQSQAGGQRHQTAIFKIHSVDECKGVILALIDKKSVLLNMDELDSLQAQRTLDTMSGATFAIGAKLSRASDRTWLITPSTVEVDDGQNEMGGSYGSRYM